MSWNAVGRIVFVGLCLGASSQARAWSEAEAAAALHGGDRAAAVDYARRWTRAEPGQPVAWAYLGLAQDQSQNDPAAAVISLKHAVTLDPAYARAWNALAVIERRLGNIAEAEDAERHTVQTPQGATLYWHRQVRDLAQARRWNSAVEAARKFEEAIAGSRSPNDWFILGNDYKDLGEFERSIDAYRHVIAIDPNIGDAWNNMGVAQQYMGQNATAYDDYQKAASLGNKVAVENSRKLVAAEAARRQQLQQGQPTTQDLIRAREQESLRKCGRWSCN